MQFPLGIAFIHLKCLCTFEIAHATPPEPYQIEDSGLLQIC